MAENESPRKSMEMSSLHGAEPKRKQKQKKRSKSPDAPAELSTKPLPFLEPDEFSDVTIIVDDKHLYSNRCLLCYSSAVFCKHLASDGSKSKGNKANKELDLSEKQYDDICDLLTFIDPRVDSNLTDEDACRLLPLAAEYEVKAMVKACEFAITQAFFKMRKGRRAGTMATEVVISNLCLADKYHFTDLQEMCISELAASDNPYSGIQISDNDQLSEYMKRQVLERKLEKLNMALIRERRMRTEKCQTVNTKGDKLWKK